RTVRASFELKVVGSRPQKKAAASKPEPLILEFTATPLEAAPGSRVSVCYLVADNATVRLEPDLQRPPGPRGCISLALPETTRFVLTATAPDGRSETQSVTVKVR
ncbi:MAG: hypothetical protein ACPL88_03715, partial [Bryobacteraceae bacterium]